MTREEEYQEALCRIAEAREKQLTELDLTTLLWDHIPPELFELEWLESLSIAWGSVEVGQIKQLPPEIKQLKALRALDISRHGIVDLEPLASLAQLQHLVCSDNRISDLGPEFASLDGNDFLSLDAVQQAIQRGHQQLLSREGRIVESQTFRAFLQPVGREQRFAEPEQKSTPVRIFISYAHEDEKYKNRLEISLKQIKRRFNIDYWNDRQLFAGHQWEDQIFIQLEEADIVCLLISPDFIASDYCFNIEMEKALKKYNDNEGVPIPIIIRHTEGWQTYAIGQFTALPTDGKPLEDWNSEDKFWADVQRGIRRQVERILEKRRAS